jgi:hypothetical protein
MNDVAIARVEHGHVEAPLCEGAYRGARKRHERDDVPCERERHGQDESPREVGARDPGDIEEKVVRLGGRGQRMALAGLFDGVTLDVAQVFQHAQPYVFGRLERDGDRADARVDAC